MIKKCATEDCNFDMVRYDTPDGPIYYCHKCGEVEIVIMDGRGNATYL
jgi:hypothetical protein